jgi:hypothetical protein
MFEHDWSFAQNQQYQQMAELIDYSGSSNTPPSVATSPADQYPPYPPCLPYNDEIQELYYNSVLDPSQIPRQSISPPLIPGDRPHVSQKRRKPRSVPSEPPPMATIHSDQPFLIEEERSHLHTRPPPIQLDNLYCTQTNEGYLTPPLTSNFFAPPDKLQGPFGGYTSPTMVPSDIM